MENVKLFEQHLKDEKGKGIGKIAILVGGLNESNPKEYMDKMVSKYVGYNSYNQFVDIHLDNPWTRVIIRGINNVEFKPMQETDFLANEQ